MDKPGEQDFNVLLKGYLDESLNPEDLESFLELAGKPENMLLLQQSIEKDLSTGTADLTSAEQSKDAWRNLEKKLETAPRILRSGRFYRITAAASICLIFILGASYFLRNKQPAAPANNKTIGVLPSWLKPEHIGATLYLMNGDSVKLDDQSKGVVAREHDTQIIQSGGNISYSGPGEAGVYNKIKTGSGKIFRCILPDQTVVWLNASSSIKYPLQFNKDHRSVEITGEVYFEVVHNAALPFRVKAEEQMVEDIGTTFNIDASAEKSIVTTLITGSVKVNFNDKEAVLNPGEQTLLSESKNELLVQKNSNIEKALAWKNGLFYFQNTPLHTVMEQLSNWYQAEVIYQGPDSKELFSGQIDKSLTLTQVLQGLQQPGVSFKLNDNNQIIVVQK
jgi:transmembrane sensor